jgi:hypothetical protein
VIEPDYGFAQLGEWASNGLWTGKYKGKASNVSATHPIPTVPQLWHLRFLDAPSYNQIIMEFDDALIVGEAPPQQSFQVMQWVKDNLGKNITHIWVRDISVSIRSKSNPRYLTGNQSTHHHHDHSYGTRDYIAAGATAIVLDTAVEYWSNIPGIKFETYS